MEPIRVPGALFPIYFHDGSPLPDKGTYYVIAQDGMYMVKDTGLVRATVKVEKFSMLEALPRAAKLLLPKIPVQKIAQALMFFRRVYDHFRTEAAILLYYSNDRKEYMLDAFNQFTTFVSTQYDIRGKYSDFGYQLVGTIHSHCDFEAFHSGIDVKNEKDFDGIHITIGQVHQPYFTISCTAAVNDNRFPLEAENVVEGISKVDYVPVERRQPQYRRQNISRPQSDKLYGSKFIGGIVNGMENILEDMAEDFGIAPNDDYAISYPQRQFYDLALPDNMDYRHCRFPNAWMDRINTRRRQEGIYESI